MLMARRPRAVVWRVSVAWPRRVSLPRAGTEVGVEALWT